ncbi:Druantia anti-phage system protein DruA [Sphingomicrobium arenosum]|uniref:Druantia anti-phage system protein DruA n=1 Tax=Sphingomicrobium arenosum TaxID=2233861 RepID=UPI002240EBE6|nr:Druantia anti-phage system protein DruA [Sphingomicrobium arenosum]
MTFQDHREAFRECWARDVSGARVADGPDRSIVHKAYAQKIIERARRESGFFAQTKGLFQSYIAQGSSVSPERICPRLVIVTDNFEKKLFRAATSYWSIPVSQGFGRRIRFLVIDENTGCLIGIFAIGDPVFNLAARDRYIDWTSDQRVSRLSCVMDAYVLGALPPYSSILGGKLVASLVRSREVSQIFDAKYGNRESIISGRCSYNRLAMVTVSSAFGRSSLYNRLKLDGDWIFRSVGYSKGWGHHHVTEEAFDLAKKLLSAKQSNTLETYEFGKGPNWKIRVLREAMKIAGIARNELLHGIQREVFVSEFGANTKAYLCGLEHELDNESLSSVECITKSSLRRWVLPRADRRKDFVLSSPHATVRQIERNLSLSG